MSDRWLSVEEIAEYLGVSKDTVYAWISKRNMPAHRIGRLWKFKTVGAQLNLTHRFHLNLTHPETA